MSIKNYVNGTLLSFWAIFIPTIICTTASVFLAPNSSSIDNIMQNAALIFLFGGLFIYKYNRRQLKYINAMQNPRAQLLRSDIMPMSSLKPLSWLLIVVIATALKFTSIIWTMNLSASTTEQNIANNAQAAPNPFVALLAIAILAPLSEEFFYRGVLFGIARKSGSGMVTILLTTTLFGLSHFNLRQATYAAVLGFYIGMIVWITHNFFAGFFIHSLLNFTSLVSLYAFNIDGFIYVKIASFFAKFDNPYMYLSILLPLFAVLILLIVALCKHENTLDDFAGIFKNGAAELSQGKSKIVWISAFILGAILLVSSVIPANT